MPITKFVNGRNRNIASVNKAIKYVTNPQKTNENLISGIGILGADTAYIQMISTKKLHRQDDGRQYVHIVQSFSQKDGISHETTHEIAKKSCCFYGNEYQMLIATHTNTKHPHSHIILNTVNVRTGKKFRQSKKEMADFKEYTWKICKDFGYSPNSAGHTSLLTFDDIDQDESHLYYLDHMSDYDIYEELILESGSELVEQTLQTPQKTKIDPIFWINRAVREPAVYTWNNRVNPIYWTRNNRVDPIYWTRNNMEGWK